MNDSKQVDITISKNQAMQILYLVYLLLLEVYSFEGFSNQHQNDGMTNNYRKTGNFGIVKLW